MSAIDRRQRKRTGARRGLRSRQPYRKPFAMRNIVQVKPRPGRYWIYGRRGKVLYHGSSKQLGPKKLEGGKIDPKHPGRLLDEFYGRGDVRTVPKKAEMIENAEKFDIKYGNNIWDNREAERDEKRRLKPPHNLR